MSDDTNTKDKGTFTHVDHLKSLGYKPFYPINCFTANYQIVDVNKNKGRPPFVGANKQTGIGYSWIKINVGKEIG
jgi:hypothetical protein